MKNLLLGALLLLSTSVFSQDSFVKHYTKMQSLTNSVLQTPEVVEVTAVFNENNTSTTVLYFKSGKSLAFYKISEVVSSQTENNQKYQVIRCMDQDGNKVSLQLFDDGDLRIVISKGFTITFYQ